MKNVLEMLEASAEKYPQKFVFADENKSVTYSDFVKTAKSIGCAVSKLGTKNKPIAVLIPRSVENLIAMMGVVYSGNFYVVIDSEMPADRVKLIFNALNPVAVLAADECSDKIKELDTSAKVIYYNNAEGELIDDKILSDIRSKMIDTDPLYALFTSGSTGVPKGAVVCHKNVLTYIDWYSKTFDINEETVFGSQTPFYFSMSVSDVYSTMYCGSTLNIIPKKFFSFPMKLLEFLNERAVNTIYWVPSALCIVANWKVLDYGKAEHLNKILFAGEVMPTKQLNYWINHIPDALYANLFGPTETTDICTYYIVDRKFSDGESLPIGRHCNNCDVFIVKDDGTEADTGEEGELYARGSFLAMGYYNNPEKTAAAFVQNPINKNYPEIVYKTGDLVKYNEKGELIYITRKDFQIKHMGYRIELGEVEAAASAVENITACAALYDDEEDKIVMIYQGNRLDDAKMVEALKNKLPSYMMPNAYVRTRAMPYNQNGKIDRVWLKNNYKTM